MKTPVTNEPDTIRDLDETTEYTDVKERTELLMDHSRLTVDIFKTSAIVGQELTRTIAGIGDMDALQSGVDTIKSLNEQRAAIKGRLEALAVFTVQADAILG